MKKSFLISIVALVLLIAFYVFNKNPEVSKAGSSDNVSGWAWSENIGWISFNCTNEGSCGQSNYGVNIDLTTGLFSGYAWSSNIGWISFNTADLAGCPSGACEARIPSGLTGGTFPKSVTGWAKVLSNNTWMSLRGTNPNYGVQLESNSSGTLTTSNNFSGWSWEPEVIGWTSWSGSGYSASISIAPPPPPPPPPPTSSSGGESFQQGSLKEIRP